MGTVMDIQVVAPDRIVEALAACAKRHEALYARYLPVFHEYVAQGMQAFLAAHDPARDRVWQAVQGGEVLGWAAVQHTDQEAQLRWFLVEPAARGQGIGRRLLQAALVFVGDAGYRGVFLWTVSDLAAARRLYQQAGFRLVDEHEAPCAWAPWAHEQRWERGTR